MLLQKKKKNAAQTLWILISQYRKKNITDCNKIIFDAFLKINRHIV